MGSYEQIAEALRTEYMRTVRVKRSRFLHTAWANLPKQYKEPWIAAAKAAYRQVLAPDPTLQDLNAGLDAVYITVRAGEAQCQQAIPREIVSNMRYPEQLIGGIVLEQIKVVDSIKAAAKEKKDDQDT